MTNQQKCDATILFWQNVRRLRQECLGKQSQGKQPLRLMTIKQPQLSIELRTFSRERREEAIA
jgi:hypothetical protein